MADLTDRITEVADGPASASGQAGSVQQQSISELIKADDHLATKATATAAKADGKVLGRFLGRAKVVFPSALGQ